MRQAVEDSYSAIARGESCDCSLSTASPTAQSCCSKETSLVTFESNPVIESQSCCKPAAQVTRSPEASTTIETYVPSLGCGNPISIANLQPGEVVLDVGSGGGLDALLAAKKVGKDGKVIGVDMTEPMLERARIAAMKVGVENVEFRFGYAENLPLEDSYVDVVISNCVINLCEEKGLAFCEIYRVLQQGGRLEVSDIVTSGPFPFNLRTEAQEWAACVSGALPESEYLDLIAQAGFKDVLTRNSTDYVQTSGVQVLSVHVSARK